MSLNEIVDQNYKPWLDSSVNSIKIDGDWTYKESTKAVGDNLVLDNNLVAQWVTLPGNTPYGNGIAVRPAQQGISNITAPLNLNYLAPFSQLYTFTNGSNQITINLPGTYLIYANVTYHNNVDNSFLIEITRQNDVGTAFTTLPGSVIRNFPGTTIFSSDPPIQQYSNVCVASIIKTLTPNRGVRLVCSTSSSGNLIDSQYSSFVIIRVASV